MDTVTIAIEPLRAFLVQVGAALPRLGVALLVVLAGWLLSKAVRFAAVKAMRALNMHVLTQRSGIDAFLQQGGSTRDTVDLAGMVLQWLVLVAALMVASNGLGLAQVSDLLSRVLLFLPRLLVVLLVLVLGMYFARFAAQSVAAWCRAEGIGDAPLLSRLVQVVINAFVLLMALDHLDIGGGLVQKTFLIVLAGVVLALALAFGLGGRERAAALLERWVPRRGPPGAGGSAMD